jgi:hypothetical protein
MADDRPVPEDPEAVGLTPDELTIEEVEPVHLVANAARDKLRKAGFTDDEIDEWARVFVESPDTTDDDDFVEWIRREEKTPRANERSR